MRPYATSVCGLKLLVYEAFCTHTTARLELEERIARGLKLLVYEALSY